MEKNQVKDVALNTYRFYLSEADGDGESEIKNKETLFRRILNGAVDKIGGWANTAQGVEPVPIRERGTTFLIANSKSPYWLIDQNEIARKLISRSLLDVYSLQTAVAKVGTADVTAIAGVIEKLPKFEPQVFEQKKDDFSLKTKCQCIFIELDEDIEKYSLKEIFDNAFIGVGIQKPLYREIDLGYAKVAILESRKDAVWTIVPARAEDVDRAGSLIDDILPEYFLSFAKVENENRLAANDIRNAKKSKARLSQFLDDDLKKLPASLSLMEDASEKLADFRANLAVEITRARRHLLTIGINVGNAERLLESSLLFAKKDELKNLLLEPLRLKQEQIAADLSYCEIDLTRGISTNEKLKDITQIWSSVWSRRFTIMFGLLSLLGILQLFPEFASCIRWYWRIAILAGVAAIFITWALLPEILKRRRSSRSRNANDIQTQQLPSSSQNLLTGGTAATAETVATETKQAGK